MLLELYRNASGYFGFHGTNLSQIDTKLLMFLNQTEAHNLKVISSNLVPATKIQKLIQQLMQSPALLIPAGLLLLVRYSCPFFVIDVATLPL